MTEKIEEEPVIENDDLLGGCELESTDDIEVPRLLIEQVIGQEHAVEIIKKAAIQRRHVMMIGTPGTGKSMLARAMSELLPKEELQESSRTCLSIITLRMQTTQRSGYFLLEKVRRS